MSVDDEGERITVEEASRKKMRMTVPSGPSVARKPEAHRISTPSAQVVEEGVGSRKSSADFMGDATVPISRETISMISSLACGDVRCGEGSFIPDKERHRYSEWLKKHLSIFERETVSSIRDSAEDLKIARKEELRKLNDVHGAFKPRDRRELPKRITMFGHKWFDKVSEGIAKARLTCQDFKMRGAQAEDKNSSESPSNFCPTPHGCSRKILDSLKTGFPRVKAGLSSAFLITRDQGDNRGQSVMMVPPREWLEQYDEWLVSQPDDVRWELDNVPASEIVWQVDGNLYGRQSAAAQYRDRLEEILASELKGDYEFIRGKLDACIYRCQKTGTVLLHHIDDFDVCGPEKVLNDLLTVQLPFPEQAAS